MRLQVASKIVLTILPAAIAVQQALLFFGIGVTTSPRQPLTIGFYILLFWLASWYATLPTHITPLVRFTSGQLRAVVAAWTLVYLAMFVLVSSRSTEARLAAERFGVLNLFLSFCYSLVAYVLVVGDRWLGAFARFLKLGRRFPRKE